MTDGEIKLINEQRWGCFPEPVDPENSLIVIICACKTSSSEIFKAFYKHQLIIRYTLIVTEIMLLCTSISGLALKALYKGSRIKTQLPCRRTILQMEKGKQREKSNIYPTPNNELMAEP